MPDSLNVLVLHRLGNPALAPHFLVNHVYALRNSFPQHNYIYHDINLKLPGYVRAAEFDAIVLDVTFLCIRWSPRAEFERLKEEYRFVASSPALKLAFPQDEYDHHADLDDWMCEWNVDVVFSVISGHWEVLFPRFVRQGEIRLGYTGYIDDTLLATPVRPCDDRGIDIGYRANKLPANFGRLGQVKWTIGRDVAPLAAAGGFSSDIVLGNHGRLAGAAWLDFLNNCRFALGANSGSSLLDPRGEIGAAIRRFLRNRPDASFEEIEANCFPGQDGRYEFTAISPRVLEAAVLECCQILVAGEYSGLIRPFEHYIPIKPDASDFAEVARAMRDRALVQRLVANCRETILDTPVLRYTNKAKAVLELIEARRGGADRVAAPAPMRQMAERYRREMRLAEARHWFLQATRYRLARRAEQGPGFARALRWARNRLRGR